MRWLRTNRDRDGSLSVVRRRGDDQRSDLLQAVHREVVVAVSALDPVQIAALDSPATSAASAGS